MPRTASVSGIEVSVDHWVGGERLASDATFPDISPLDQQVLANIARGGPREVSAAVDAASAAFPQWAATPRTERAALLHAVAEGIEKRVDDLALVETLDNGGLLRSHRRSVIPRAAYNFHFFADFLLQLGHEDFETRGHRNHISWQPAGVTAVITPWNAPLMLATWRVAPALAAGNTVVLKPPEWAPLTASLLADITAEAGLPPGVFNVVQGIGEEAGAALVRDPRVRRIAFTGSVATARAIGHAAAENVIPVSFELGGKNPFIVFPDADLDLAVRHAVDQYDNAGQVCLAGTRLYVADAVYDEFLERFLQAASAWRVGDPRSEDVDMGPQIHPDHLARIDGYVRRAKAAGATVLLGGGPHPELGGLYYQPTLLTNVADDSEINREEVFGPVIVLHRFTDEDEVIRRANDNIYGLAAMVFTGDRSRAERVADRLVAGTVWVNCFYVRDLRAPFGGARLSGIGREGGTWSFDFYAEVKNTVTAPSGWLIKEANGG